MQDRLIHKHRLDRKPFGPDDGVFLMLVIFSRLGIQHLLVEVLHIKMRLLATLLQMTARLLLALKCPLDTFNAHCRDCLGVKSRLLWLTEKGPEVCCSGRSATSWCSCRR